VTRIDFYILPDGGGERGDPTLTACKLCDKAIASGARVYIQVSDAGLADRIDDALWTLRQGSFVAHERYRGTAIVDPQPAVLIGDGEPPETHHGILINMDVAVPMYFSRFERVLEIVPGEPAMRSESRVRFKFYRDRGYSLATHNL